MRIRLPFLFLLVGCLFACGGGGSTSNSITAQPVQRSTPVLSSVAVSSITPTDFTVTANGSSFLAGAQIVLNGATLTTITGTSTQIKTAALSVPLNSSLSFQVVNPDGGTSNTVQVAASAVTQANVTAAARLLTQASWGPTVSSIARVQQIGASAWIDEQFAAPVSTISDAPSPAPSYCTGISCIQQFFFQNALTGPDQLRQRVGFALSKIWVISGVEIPSASAFPAYLNLLNNDALTNYSKIMRDVTLFPGMGQYLNMVNSDKPAPGLIANENYARELMQLFTIGTATLNQDGTPLLDGQGNPTQPYTEAQVQATARALTGWTYPLASGATPTWPNNTPYYGASMVAIDAHHDTTSKTLVSGAVLPAGQTATQDLDGALTDIFNNPNVPPFVCRQLIQQLVTSNPSPAYVNRIAAIFKDNGSGVRGDMKAVVKAILLDVEARRGDTAANAAADDGHLLEPVLYITALLRALNASASDPNAFASSLATFGQNMSQRVLYPGSVFSYFSPSWVISGTTLDGPEFQIQTTATTIVRQNFADSVIRNSLGGGVTIDLTSYVNLAGNPQQLVDTLDNLLTRGTLSATDKQAVVAAVSSIASTNPQARARTAIYLIASSSQFQVLR